MGSFTNLDCVVIGYNETPFEEYEALLRNYGKASEAYRDIKFSFVDIDGAKLTYVDLLNHIYGLAHPEGTRDQFKSGDIPNLAAVYLTSYLRKRQFNATYVNLYQYEKSKLIDLLASDPLCIAITTTFYVLSLPVIEMVQFIRKHNDKVKIVVGGPLVSNHYHRNDREQFLLTLEDMGADIYVISSQGEQTLSRVVECLKTGADLGDVPNLVYRNGRGWEVTSVAVENNSLDDDAIDWTLFADMELGHTIQTRTARSCAFSCAFCGYPARAGKLTLANLGTIQRELDALQMLGVRNVVFIDDTFNVPLKRFKEICRLFIKQGYDFNWFSYFRCSNSDEEAIDLMAQSGCKGVFLGIESGSPAILQNMHKAAAVEQYRAGIQRLRHNHILTFGSFIAGFPGETDGTIAETIDFINDTRLDYYRMQLWYCEPDTPIYAKRDTYGVVGEGFTWRHNTMDSLEAMDHIDRVFLSVKDSLWLPQWSFDFWFIPYIIGKGISFEDFREFMLLADKFLALEIASVPTGHKPLMQGVYVDQMVKLAKTWH